MFMPRIYGHGFYMIDTSGLWNRPDFQKVYQTPDQELCLDTLQKPGAERAQFEITALSKWLSNMKTLQSLDEELKTEILRVAVLQVIPANTTIYMRRDQVHWLYMIQTGMVQLSNLDNKAVGMWSYTHVVFEYMYVC